MRKRNHGGEAVKLQSFILDLMRKGSVILVKGNHEDLYEELVTYDHGLPYSYHMSNGTYDTALQLTGFDWHKAITDPFSFVRAARETPYYQTMIPAMVDYY